MVWLQTLPTPSPPPNFLTNSFHAVLGSALQSPNPPRRALTSPPLLPLRSSLIGSHTSLHSGSPLVLSLPGAGSHLLTVLESLSALQGHLWHGFPGPPHPTPHFGVLSISCLLPFPKLPKLGRTLCNAGFLGLGPLFLLGQLPGFIPWVSVSVSRVAHSWESHPFLRLYWH